ncbi:ATP-grasp domain-containing protein [Pseudovibrio ascidiaceicola]|uniref:ATP-grasp domain-containing protein n=1 Tax=Pseudovibrio ascidiaceicola TaxID=285279 RepID=UPI003D36393A
MAHICFIDSSSTGLNALKTAQRLGHDVTLVIPEKVSVLSMMNVPSSKVDNFLGPKGRSLTVDDADLEATVLKVNRDRKIDLVLTTSELAVMPTANLAKKLNTRYDSPEALDKTVYKNRCREILAQNNIRSTPFAIVSSFEEAINSLASIGYPAVLKPTRGVAKEASAILYNETDLRSFFDAYTAGQTTSPGIEEFLSAEFVIEAYIQGPLHSAEVLAVDGIVHILTTTQRERAKHDQLIETIASMPSMLTDQEISITQNYLQSIFNVLGLEIGIYHIEFIWSPSGPVLVEINPRMMGGIAPLLFEQLTGADPYELMINAHLSAAEPKKWPQFKGNAGVMMAVGSPNGGKLPEDAAELVESVLADYEVLVNTLNVSANQVLPPFKGNFSTLGILALRSPDKTKSLEIASELLLHLERVLQIEIANISL